MAHLTSLAETETPLGCTIAISTRCAPWNEATFRLGCPPQPPMEPIVVMCACIIVTTGGSQPPLRLRGLGFENQGGVCQVCACASVLSSRPTAKRPGLTWNSDGLKQPNLGVSGGEGGCERSGLSGSSAGGRPPSASHPTPASLRHHSNTPRFGKWLAWARVPTCRLILVTRQARLDCCIMRCPL